MLLCSLSLLACDSRPQLAPVSSGWFSPAHEHVVRRGETLYSIAFHYDTDYRRLAFINHLRPPYTVYVGQRLQLLTIVKGAPIRQPAPRQPKQYLRQHWIRPCRGPIVATFSPEQGRKGIDISGRRGQPIVAAAAGVVAYSGNGLVGYGNLIIIKHDRGRLTAYGYNARNVVHEGQHVAAGQKIAEMGQVDRRFWGVHFEVREAGHPVNPLRYVSVR
jgi:lipoprotein NlpD